MSRFRVVQHVLLVGVALAASACAGPSQTQSADGERMVCVRETLTGTRIPTVACRSVAQIEHDREHAEKELNFVKQGYNRPRESASTGAIAAGGSP